MNPDVIFAHGQLPRLPQNCPVPLVGIEYFGSDHQMRLAGNLHLKPLEIRAKRWSMAHASAVITTTPASKERLEEYLPDLRGRVRQIPIYMPYLEAATRDAVTGKQMRDGPLRVLFVGATARRKGLPQLLEALRMLAPAIRSQIELTVVTRFADGRVDNIPQDVRVTSRVSLEELKRLMNDSAVFAFPTQLDTFGRVIVEAMAHGCAILSSNEDPQDWMLDFGKAGIGVNPASPEEIAAGLTLLTRDVESRTAYALKALKRFSEVFHHSIVARQYREVFENVITGGREVAAGHRN